MACECRPRRSGRCGCARLVGRRRRIPGARPAKPAAATSGSRRTAGMIGAVTIDGEQRQWIDALVRADAPSQPAATDALLVDYPVALGRRQREEIAGLLRELQLVVIGSRQSRDRDERAAAAARSAEGITATYGAQLDPAEAEMDRAAAAAGHDRPALRAPAGQPGRRAAVRRCDGRGRRVLPAGGPDHVGDATGDARAASLDRGGVRPPVRRGAAAAVGPAGPHRG